MSSDRHGMGAVATRGTGLRVGLLGRAVNTFEFLEPVRAENFTDFHHETICFGIHCGTGFLKFLELAIHSGFVQILRFHQRLIFKPFFFDAVFEFDQSSPAFYEKLVEFFNFSGGQVQLLDNTGIPPPFATRQGGPRPIRVSGGSLRSIVSTCLNSFRGAAQDTGSSSREGIRKLINPSS